MFRYLVRRFVALFGAATALVVLVVLAFGSPAGAHDPIFITEDQTSPETGPYMPDGTISFAIYGSLYAAEETRGMEFDLRDGDDLYLSLLIPDLEPEINLADDALPVMSLILPDGSTRDIAPDIRTKFADPFSRTNYVTLFETIEPAAGGRHQLVVTGQGPSRFVVAVGTKEEFFTPTERSGDKPTSFPGIAAPLNAWYTTPADGSAPTEAASAAADEVNVDVEMIEEALSDNETEQAEAEQSSTDNDSADDVDTADEDAAAGVDVDDDGDGSGLSLVAPIAMAVAAIGGGLFYLNRRREAA